MKTRTLIASFVVAPLAVVLLAGTAFAATITQQLEVGSRGTQVSDLQTFLAQDNTIYPQGLVTGYFGSLTKSAVSNFQARNGIDTVGRVGPITMAAINSQMGGVAGSATAEGAGLATRVGVTQPALSNFAVSVSTNSATINWNSDTTATEKVWYSTSYPFNMLTAASVSRTDSPSNAQSVTITGLQGNTTYYYVVQSLDANGNFSWSQNGPSFKTQ